MYELKTLTPKFDITLPNCMYTLKNISLQSGSETRESLSNGNVITSISYDSLTPVSSSINEKNSRECTLPVSPVPCVLDLDVLAVQIQQIIKASNDDQAVIERQEQLLQQLNDLKKQLDGLRSNLGLCQKGPQHTRLSNGGLREEPLNHVVINGHPNFIPYGLLAMKNAWKDLFTIELNTFTHSTMPDIGPEAKKFEEMLKEVPVYETNPKIKLTLIWKNCEHTEMICSPTMYVPIYGEINILRYLGRIGPEEYRYEKSPLVNEIDLVLDICYQLLRCTTDEARTALLNTLSDRLKKQKYFGGDQMSIADIGVHSSLKRLPTIKEKNLTPKLRDWCKRASKTTRI